MPRPLRVECGVATYHMMRRGVRSDDILLDEGDWRTFLRTLGEAWAKTGWEIHACVLETPKGHPVQDSLARTLREFTPMTRPWIAERLRVGGASYVSALLGINTKN